MSKSRPSSKPWYKLPGLKSVFKKDKEELSDSTFDNSPSHDAALATDHDTKNAEPEAQPSTQHDLRVVNVSDNDKTKGPEFIIALFGSVGVGKTAFIRSVRAALRDVQPDDLNDATFASVMTETTTRNDAVSQPHDDGDIEFNAVSEIPEAQEHALYKDRPLDIGVTSVPMGSTIGDLVFIEFPGLNGVEETSERILQHIVEYLEVLFKQGRRLSGVLYLHRITDIRFDQGVITSLRNFKHIYGEEGNANLALITTMWNDVRPDALDAFKGQETQLKATLWATFIQQEEGAVVARYDHSNATTAKDSALKIISELLRQAITGADHTLLIERELINERKELPRTKAGRAAFTQDEKLRYYLSKLQTAQTGVQI